MCAHTYMKQKKLVVKPIPVALGSKHPLTPNEVLPQHEFSMALIAPKGSGKTTLLCNILMFFKGYFNKIIIISPTINNDEKWDYIKKQPLLVENVALQKFVKALEEKEKHQNDIVGKPPASEAFKGLLDLEVSSGKKKRKLNDFDGLIPEEHYMTEYSNETLSSLVAEQDQMISVLQKHGKSKHLADRVLFIFDDMVGSQLFSGTRDNPFKRLNTNHRHGSFSILMVSQAYKEIPKTVRTNISCLIMFEIFSDAELEAICAEYPMELTKDQWMEMYKYCVDGDHNFLYYNMQKPKRMRIMKNFSEVVFFQ